MEDCLRDGDERERRLIQKRCRCEGIRKSVGMGRARKATIFGRTVVKQLRIMVNAAV